MSSLLKTRFIFTYLFDLREFGNISKKTFSSNEIPISDFFLNILRRIYRITYWQLSVIRVR